MSNADRAAADRDLVDFLRSEGLDVEISDMSDADAAAIEDSMDPHHGR